MLSYVDFASKQRTQVRAPIDSTLSLALQAINQGFDQIVIVTETLSQLHQLERLAKGFFSETTSKRQKKLRWWTFNDWEILPYELIAPSQQAISWRLEKLSQLFWQEHDEPLVILTALPTLISPTSPKSYFAHHAIQILI